MTHDHFAVLLVHRFLLRQLDGGSTVHPWGEWKVRTYLVLRDGISNVLREFAHRSNVCIVFSAPSCICSLRDGAQLVLGSFKSSEIDGFGKGTQFRCMITHSSRSFLRLDSSSSSVVSPPRLSLPNLARVDSIFPFTPGTVYPNISRWLVIHVRYFTSRSFNNSSKDIFILPRREFRW